MSLIALSTLYYDPNGALVFQTAPEDSAAALSVSRRVTRTATLDGGAVIVDGGYSIADRTIQLKPDADTPESDILALQRIFRTYSMVLLFTADGAFLAAPQGFLASGGTVVATFLVKAEAEVTLS